MVKNKGGRPKKDISQKEFENLCKMMCTKVEICNWFDVDEKTITARCHEWYGVGFSDIYKQLSQYGIISLRRAQLKLAEKNASMAIFLGKQYLGQTDKVEYTGEERITIVDN